MGDSVSKYYENLDRYTTTTTNMKESKLIKMQTDLKIAQQALVVALNRIEKLEAKVFPKDDLEDKEIMFHTQIKK
ncbi:MAG: hypothetical protein Tp156SUR1554471_20 [Prokaryotic dsDNA virus sp.]|nr:MAG: hypothetical protein Tp156SUR1554471_20 [Prokaryotic dsDNA virus sp.]|tara:strand:- start:17612 stop:17836 length:225 start_codon:yes stop_codon:yes gene_type:complete